MENQVNLVSLIDAQLCWIEIADLNMKINTLIDLFWRQNKSTSVFTRCAVFGTCSVQICLKSSGSFRFAVKLVELKSGWVFKAVF